MAAKFSLSDSLAERQKLTNAQYREIERLYKDLARKAAKEAERLKSSTVSGKLQAVELGKLEKKLQEEADKIGARLESSIPSSMKKAAAGVVSDAASFQGKLGISIEGAYRRVPTDIVETLVSGKLYKGKWSLSKSIWADISKTQSDISKVVAEGIALNKSSYDIAKDLEMYVDPSAKKPWDWSKVYPGTKKKIDYNAQRLARTMVGHAYQQSVVAVCKDDPFVDGIEWISGHSTTTCELCRDRNGKVFPAGKLPLDHPNGKCSFAPHVSKSLSQVGDDLADWVKGKPNEQLDNWARSLMGYTPTKNPNRKEKTVSEGVAWVSRLTEDEREALKDYTGASYSGVNNYLRGDNRFDTADIRRIVDGVHSSLQKASLPSELEVFRGSDVDGLVGMIPGFSHRLSWMEKGENLDSLVGTELVSKSFMSTSMDSPLKQYVRGVKYHISLPEGSKASYLGAVSIQGNEEKEVLIDKDSRFILSDIKYTLDEDGYATGTIEVFLKLKSD